MNTISTTSTAAPGLWTNGLLTTLQRWWLAYSTWRNEQAAIAALGSMSDRELKDMGIYRCEIESAVTAPRAGSCVKLNQNAQ